MANFDIAFKISMGHEGGYANDPVDTGGETIFGITRRDWPNSQIWKKVDEYKKNHDIKAAIPLMNKDPYLLALAKEIYKKSYWDVNSLDKINNQTIANELFDTGINMGIGIASRFLQRALNYTNRNQILYRDISIDGNVGPATLHMINNHPNITLVLKVLNVLQGSRYIEIIERAPAQERFVMSWFSRVSL
jgi:lysozyme family protein